MRRREIAWLRETFRLASTLTTYGTGDALFEAYCRTFAFGSLKPAEIAAAEIIKSFVA